LAQTIEKSGAAAVVAAKRPQPAEKVKRRRKFFVSFRATIPFYIMLLPGIIVLIINNYLPMFGVVIAFKNYRLSDSVINSIIRSKFIGLDNFKFIFGSSLIYPAIRNTLVYNVIFIATGVIVPTAMAIGLTEIWGKKLSKIYQSFAFLPYFLSWIIVSYLAFSLFSYDNGFIDKGILAAMGLPRVNWYANIQAWPYILVLFQLWKYTGYNIVVYMASISGINDEYYEAATLDGATKFQQARYITLPMLKTIMIIVTLLAVGKIFNSDFGLFYSVPKNNGILYPVTQVIDTYVYHMLVNSGNPSMTAAAGLVQSLAGCITVFTANLIVRKIDKDSALF
jgi:putative aldouronate transport system permease protein